MIRYLTMVSLLLNLNIGCKEKESIITIVDIGHFDRTGIAKELVIINDYSPKVVGLDFLLTADSLNKDIPLIDILSRMKNVVQASTLHNNDPMDVTKWDSLEGYHPKFRFAYSGFNNLTITDDSVIVRELPMQQKYRDETVFAFSYLVASQYNSNKINSKYKNDNKDYVFDETTIGHYFKVISKEDLMLGNFDKNDIMGKIVLLGVVSSKEDLFYLNEMKSDRISGVEFHASIIREILD